MAKERSLRLAAGPMELVIENVPVGVNPKVYGVVETETRRTARFSVVVRLSPMRSPPRVYAEEWRGVVGEEGFFARIPRPRAYLELRSGRPPTRVAGLYCFSDPRHMAAALAMFVRSAFAQLVLLRGGLVLHAATLVRGGKAVVFAARSGGGKTTLVKRMGLHASLGDDMAVLMRHEPGFLVYPAPLCGSEGTAPRVRRAAPLAAVCYIVKSDEPKMVDVPRKACVSTVLKHCVLPDVAARTGRQALLEAAVDLSRSVPHYFMYLDLETDVWALLAKARAL